MCHEGEQLIKEGNELLRISRLKLPNIPTTFQMLHHVQHLYQMVKAKQYVEVMGSSYHRKNQYC